MQAENIIFSSEIQGNSLNILINVNGVKYSISYSTSYIFSQNYSIDNAKKLIPNIVNISKKQKCNLINYVVDNLFKYKNQIPKNITDCLTKAKVNETNIPLKSESISPVIEKPTVEPKSISSEIKKPLVEPKLVTTRIKKNIIILEKDEDSWL